jgi:hypothetical protein
VRGLTPEEKEERRLKQLEERESRRELFKDQYGDLDGPMVKAFPGWKCEYVFQPGGGQTRAVYNNPEGKQFTLLKDIEAWLGGKMQSGEDISGVVLQGQADREAMMLTTMDEKLGARGSRDEWRLFLFCSFRFFFCNDT